MSKILQGNQIETDRYNYFIFLKGIQNLQSGELYIQNRGLKKKIMKKSAF